MKFSKWNEYKDKDLKDILVLEFDRNHHTGMSDYSSCLALAAVIGRALMALPEEQQKLIAQEFGFNPQNGEV